MVDFWEGLISILVVTIPTLIGAFASKYIINSWQEKKAEFELKKDKFQLRKQILDDFNNSYIYELTKIGDIRDAFAFSYAKNWRHDSDNKTLIFDYDLPKNISEFPGEKLEEKYQDYLMQESTFGVKKWNFFSTIRVYYDNEEIDKKVRELSNATAKAHDLVIMLINSKTLVEIKSKYGDFIDSFDNVLMLSHEASRLLANSKIKKPID